MKTNFAAAPGVAVAKIWTMLAGRAGDVARISLFSEPATVPNVQVGAVAMPSASVVTVAGEPRLPPPACTAKVTLTLGTPLSLMSKTCTFGAVATAVPTVADWPPPEYTHILEGAPAVNVTVVVCVIWVSAALVPR